MTKFIKIRNKHIINHETFQLLNAKENKLSNLSFKKSMKHELLASFGNISEIMRSLKAQIKIKNFYRRLKRKFLKIY